MVISLKNKNLGQAKLNKEFLAEGAGIGANIRLEAPVFCPSFLGRHIRVKLRI